MCAAKQNALANWQIMFKVLPISLFYAVLYSLNSMLTEHNNAVAANSSVPTRVLQVPLNMQGCLRIVATDIKVYSMRHFSFSLGRDRL